MGRIYCFLILLFLTAASAKARQSPGEDYPTVVPDIKIAASSADASSAQWGEDAGKSIDGNMASLYHSSWSNTVFPVTLNYHFQNVDVLDYLVYYPRSDGGSNGNFMEIEVWVSTAAKPEFVRTGKYNFEGKGSPSVIRFSGGLKSPVTVRFVINSGMGDGKDYASCAEMMFYAKNRQTSIPKVFTDETCCELRSGVRRQDIDTIRNTFFRNLATALLNKTYPKEFRIQQYKPFPNPETAARKNKTSTYSLLDNPTGICVTDRDSELIVFVGKIGSGSISLRLTDFEKGYSATD
ncbi:MAG: carbohydrate-binding protein, partial [Bacteroidales bacterium]|nr:carbohydrate-binding protein [Bacteroidales bacterium]